MRIPAAVAGRPVGHAHFWERAAAHGITRGQFLHRSAGTLGALAGLSLLAPAVAAAKKAPSSPKPIPGGFTSADLGLPSPPFADVYHVLAPGVATPPDSEPITITDFSGHVGYSVIDGAGTGTNTATGATTRYTTNTDMRFMQGTYVGEDGRVRHGSFAFI
jgi:hypothetical protein